MNGDLELVVHARRVCGLAGGEARNSPATVTFDKDTGLIAEILLDDEAVRWRDETARCPNTRLIEDDLLLPGFVDTHIHGLGKR